MKERWIKRNSFDDNQEYAEKILTRFDIEKYHFAMGNNGYLTLLIEKNLKRYKIILDVKLLKMQVFRCDVHNRFAKSTKENYTLKKSFKDDAIWESIKYVYNDSKI